MKQETFTDIKYSCRKKKPKWEEFLEIMKEQKRREASLFRAKADFHNEKKTVF